jgi:hypothetical protein
MKSFGVTLISVALGVFTQAASAADFSFSGNIRYHNDVVRIDFTLDSDATNVRVWTDSFNSGENFDPITAVWSLPTGALVGENDDNDTIGPDQTYFDSGLVFPFLSTGSYAFTVTPYDNFAPSNLFDAFGYSGQTPIPIAEWCQPASDDCLDQKGTFWRVNLSGVDSATPPVPEPSTYLLLLGGLAVTSLVARRARR